MADQKQTLFTKFQEMYQLVHDHRSKCLCTFNYHHNFSAIKLKVTVATLNTH